MPAIDAKVSAELVLAVLQGGKDAVLGLIDGLRETDDGSDWKIRFLLQALVSEVGTDAREPQRRMLASVLLAEATGERPSSVRTFLLGRLRWIAGQDCVAGLLPVLAASDPNLGDAAAAVLVSIGPAAEAPLARALESATGRAQGLIANALVQIESATTNRPPAPAPRAASKNPS